MRRVACVPVVFLCLSACGPDDPTDGDTGLTANAEDTSSGDGDGDGPGDGDGDGDAEPFTPIPARGITITKVTANHAVNVSIANGDQWVDGSGREARLVTGRDTLIRVYHEIDPNWVERDIEARLELTVGGQTYEFLSRKTIVTNTVDTYLDGALWFALPAAEGFTETDASFRVSLWEVEPGGEELPEMVNVTPASGSQLIGFESIPMEMNVFFIPFNWNGRIPDVEDESKMSLIENEIYQTEPIQTLNTAIDSVQNGGSSNVCNMLQTVQQIWSLDGAPGNIYYVGLVDTGAASGVMGCAWINSNINADVWVDNSIG
ncbi:MAG TPA: hypothetical protein VK034_13950, partial [Enhygromyxa sp.]|nr:hypothetical protein [Enhygromyxa sp.]